MVEGKGCLGRVEPVTTTRPSTMNTQNLENVMTGFKRLAAMLAVVIALTLTGCSNSPSSGLTSYTDSYDGYRFLYPNEWIEMDASNLAPDVVLHDLIERSENLSVIINPAQAEETLTDLGTPTEVGYELSKRAIAPEGSDRAWQNWSMPNLDRMKMAKPTISWSMPSPYPINCVITLPASPFLAVNCLP